jgi:hypothetical protein
MVYNTYKNESVWGDSPYSILLTADLNKPMEGIPPKTHVTEEAFQSDDKTERDSLILQGKRFLP